MLQITTTSWSPMRSLLFRAFPARRTICAGQELKRELLDLQLPSFKRERFLFVLLGRWFVFFPHCSCSKLFNLFVLFQSGLRLGSSPKAGRRTTPAAESDDLVLSPKSALSPKSDRQQSLHGVEMADSPVLELRSSNHGSDVSVDPPLVSPRESRSPLPPARAVPLPPVNVSPRTATPGSSSPRNGASSPRPPGSPRDRPLPPPPPPLSHSLPPPSADVESEGSKSPRSRVLPNMVLAPADPPSPRSPRNRHE